MIIVLSADSTSVVDADDCTRLHVSTTLPPDEADRGLRSCGLGQLADDGTALLDLQALRSHASAAASSADWPSRWQSMIEYASAKGWLSVRGDAVQAHVEFEREIADAWTPADSSLIATSETMREVLGHFASGIVIITAQGGGGPVGFTCQSFASLSLEPPLISFSPARTSSTWPKIREIGAFCVNILAHDQEGLSAQFSRSGTDKFAGVSWLPTPNGAPVLDGVSAWIDCTLWNEYDGGDHTIVVGQVQALGIGPNRLPLLFYRGGYDISTLLGSAGAEESA